MGGTHLGGWLRSLRAVPVAVGLVAAAAAVALLYLQAGPETVAALVAAILLVAAGTTLARPLLAALRSIFMRRPPWRRRHGGAFAGSRLGFVDVTTVGHLHSSEIPEALAGLERGDAPAHLVMWIEAADRSGRRWTVLQEAGETGSYSRVAWTASVDGAMGGLDLDPRGRVDPYRAAHRLAEWELGLPLASVDVVALGTDEHVDGVRAVAVALAETSVGAEELAAAEYPNGGIRRRTHLVEVAPAGVGAGLGLGHPARWHGPAVYGLLEMLEQRRPKAWAAAERDVAGRWHQKQRFARMEREAARAEVRQPR